MLAERHLEVAHKVEHLLLGGFGEVLLYIEAADSLAHIAVGHTESALPARTLLLHTRAHFGKLKRSVGELVAQIGSCLGHIFPEVVVLDFAVGQGGKQIVGLLHSLGLGED